MAKYNQFSYIYNKNFIIISVTASQFQAITYFVV